MSSSVDRNDIRPALHSRAGYRAARVRASRAAPRCRGRGRRRGCRRERRPRHPPDPGAAEGAVQAASEGARRAGRADDAGRRRRGAIWRPRTFRRSRRWRATIPETRSCSSTTRRSSSAAATSPTRPRRSEQAKKVGRDTYYEVEADNLLHPQYFQPADGAGYPIFELTRRRPAARARDRAAARVPPALRREALPRGREAAPERARRAGRGRGRPLRRGQHHRRVLAPRSARHAFPAQPDRALPPRTAALVDRPAHAGGPRVHARASSSGRRRRWGARRPSSCAASPATKVDDSAAK